jgi:hypothetical protein
MPKVKISEFSSTPANNTDIDSINIAEGCAPSGINDAIRELMAQLKDFQTGAVGDSFNGPVGTTTAAAGAFTTLSSTGNTTLGDASGDSVTINGTATFANANPTLSAGTANGVAYLNGSKVVTSGSALTFDGTSLGVGTASPSGRLHVANTGTAGTTADNLAVYFSSTNRNSNVYILAKNTDGSTINFGDGDSSTVGRISYDHASNYMAFDANGSEQMRLTSTGLGIGTSSPAAKLHIKGSSNPAIYWENSSFGSATNAAFMGSAGQLIFGRTGVADWLTIDNSGNLGLGVTPKAWSSYTSFDLGTYGSVYTSGGFAATGIASNAFYNGSNWIYKTSNPAFRFDTDLNKGFAWYSTSTGTAGNAITFTQAMTLDASGNLGIGTTSIGGTSSNRQLTVVGSSSSQATFTGSGSFSCNIGTTGSVGYVETTSTAPLTFYTNSAERARIDSSGNLLVGLTSLIGSGRTEINATSTNPSLCLRTPQSSGTVAVQIFFDGDNTDCGSIDVNTTANTTAYTTSSDYRLKENVVSMTGALATVGQLNPVTWNWKHAPEITGQGFIAHELQAIIPDAVVGEKDAVDENGNIKAQGIDTSFLVATLTAAIQELNAKFEAYKASHP